MIRASYSCVPKSHRLRLLSRPYKQWTVLIVAERSQGECPQKGFRSSFQPNERNLIVYWMIWSSNYLSGMANPSLKMKTYNHTDPLCLRPKIPGEVHDNDHIMDSYSLAITGRVSQLLGFSFPHFSCLSVPCVFPPQFFRLPLFL